MLSTAGGSAGFNMSNMSQSRSPTKSRSSPTLKAKTKWGQVSKLPRDGPASGGGKMAVGDRSIFEAFRTEAEAEREAEEEAAILEATRRPSRQGKGKTASRTSTHEGSRMDGETVSATSDTGGGSPGPKEEDAAGLPIRRVGAGDGPEARRRVELMSKWDKAEAIRQNDQKIIRERIEKGKELRAERFNRLLDSVGNHGGLAMEAAENIRHLERHQEERRRELSLHYDENVNMPLATQVFNHLNPADRALHQRLMGSKSVSWQLPTDHFRVVANVDMDPVRRPVIDNARENAFHQAATSLLGRSNSSPDIFQRSMQIDRHSGQPGGVVPRALSRPVLEPMEWTSVKLQGTPYGRFSQICEHGPGFPRTKRGGTDKFLPDESDGIATSGVRTSRLHGYGDKGILKGDLCTSGEAAEYRSWEGASSGAPAQDHYTYEKGDRITDLEFPLGKKIFPEFH